MWIGKMTGVGVRSSSPESLSPFMLELVDRFVESTFIVK